MSYLLQRIASFKNYLSKSAKRLQDATGNSSTNSAATPTNILTTISTKNNDDSKDDPEINDNK